MCPTTNHKPKKREFWKDAIKKTWNNFLAKNDTSSLLFSHTIEEVFKPA